MAASYFYPPLEENPPYVDTNGAIYSSRAADGNRESMATTSYEGDKGAQEDLNDKEENSDDEYEYGLLLNPEWAERLSKNIKKIKLRETFGTRNGAASFGRKNSDGPALFISHKAQEEALEGRKEQECRLKAWEYREKERLRTDNAYRGRGDALHVCQMMEEMDEHFREQCVQQGIAIE